ncbi:cytochrome c biogenesis protein CcsA [Arthrobacter tumbae]|uniref:cytochrome c biogenesis protein CcsA n=1 Tax=Arthrobacter tumbae TaxID=163874 RepID=UPI00195B0EEE|nr:cytochrome c biogenesis protein CcsA [Arthrobacter tumbae]MBM7781625.1 heme exporter protein C [Arthrobacter tumbae]
MTTVVALTALLFGAFIAPPDVVQGNAQRLMYLHVPAAWTAYLGFLIVLLASLGVLFTRFRRSSDVARAAAEVGLALTALTLATGSLWGGLTWGTWWAWDARVLSTVAMGLVYTIYLAARSLADEERGAPGVAVLGVIGFAIVPVVHFSVLWWRTLHQPPTILAPQLNPPMDATMLFTLGAAVLAFTMLALMAIALRTRGLAEGSVDVNQHSALHRGSTSERALQ